MTVGVGRDDLVTGEAVALDVPTAGFGLRLLGGVVDGLVTVGLLWLLTWATSRWAEGFDRALQGVYTVLLTAGLLVVLPTVVETLTVGRSLGKLACGTRVVRLDNGPITGRHALVRALVGVLELWGTFGLVASPSSIIDSRGRRLGDLAAGTVVVRERIGLETPPPAAMPPALAHWAGTADIAPLPAGLALSVRQFLARRDGLSHASRAELGQQLATQVLRHVAPPPPPDADVESVLAAVIADRGRRDFERLQRDEQLRRRLGLR